MLFTAAMGISTCLDFAGLPDYLAPQLQVNCRDGDATAAQLQHKRRKK